MKLSTVKIACLLLCAQAAGTAAEIVVSKPVPPFFVKQFRVAPLNAALRRQILKTTWHAGCPVSPEDLRQLTAAYWNFAEQPDIGLIIVHKDVAEEVSAIFQDLFRHGFMIQQVQPVENYNGDDNASMAANNTSAFNCRDVTGQPGKFSNHSWGRAVDINPLTNPYVKGEKVLPPQGRKFLDRTRALRGSILSGSFVARRFYEAGWKWGGDWSDRKDYQHFEKPARSGH